MDYSNTHKHTQNGGRRQSECDHPPPHFKFNSHGTRLEDPISGDIEPGTQWNGTPGWRNHPHYSSLLQQANQIPSRQSRWSKSSSPFSSWDYVLSFRPHGWMFTATMKFLTFGCGMPMLNLPCSQATWNQSVQTWMGSRMTPIWYCAAYINIKTT